MGLTFFENINSEKEDIFFKLFVSTDIISSHFIETATCISPITKTLYRNFTSKNKQLFADISTLKKVIFSKKVLNAQEKAKLSLAWEKNISFFLLTLRSMEIQLGEEVLVLARNEILSANNGVAGSISGVVLVGIFIPMIFIVMGRVITAIQNYVLNLSKKGVQIRREKKKSDGLLYQMLPKSVALQLKVSNIYTEI